MESQTKIMLEDGLYTQINSYVYINKSISSLLFMLVELEETFKKGEKFKIRAISLGNFGDFKLQEIFKKEFGFHDSNTIKEGKEIFDTFFNWAFKKLNEKQKEGSESLLPIRYEVKKELANDGR
jgi:hypothetical protein